MNKKIYPIGTVIWHVEEHLYQKDKPYHHYVEFVVLPATITKVLVTESTHQPKEYRAVGENSDGYRTPYYFRMKDEGVRWFLTKEEAIIYADLLSDRRDRFFMSLGDAPVRRAYK